MEQKIVLRLREIYSARSEQSTNIFNELNRLETIINDEHILISSLDKQFQIYQQLSNYLNQLSQTKEQLNLFTSTNRSNHQGIYFYIEQKKQKAHIFCI
jgi:ABC-type nickel/cobalt efflux system permease component RcnA